MDPGRTSRRAVQVSRSQLAVRLGLAVYALLCAAVVLRTVVLLLGFPATVWTVKTVLAISAPVVLPLSVLPAAGRVVIGAATLADLTTAILLFAALIPFLGRRRV
jgi:hypothetical protein